MRHYYLGTACFLAAALLDCKHKPAPAPHKLGITFPCTNGTVTDPNNCGACGTICGTYGPMTGAAGGFSFIPGTCANSNCNSPIAQTAALGCFDLNNGSVVANGRCISLESDSANCGGLGNICTGFCTFGQCSDFLNHAPVLTFTGLSPAVSLTAEIVTVSGGRPPYTFTYGNAGNATVGTLAPIAPAFTTATYTPGSTGAALATTGIVDSLLVTDSAGNATVLSIPVFVAPIAWMNPIFANITRAPSTVTAIANSAPGRAANTFTPVTPSATWSATAVNGFPGLVFTGAGSQSYQAAIPTSFTGLITDPANALTMISIQGVNTTASATAFETTVTASTPTGYDILASTGPTTYTFNREADDSTLDTTANVLIGGVVMVTGTSVSTSVAGTLQEVSVIGSLASSGSSTATEASTTMTGQNIVSIGGWTAAQDTSFASTSNWHGPMGMQLLFNVVLSGNALGYWQGIARASAGL